MHEVVLHGVEHALRGLRAPGAVEVGDRMAVDDA